MRTQQGFVTVIVATSAIVFPEVTMPQAPELPPLVSQVEYEG